MVKDIEDGNIHSFEVRSMLFAKLADIQPITKSNIPLSKLRNPNMRWAWNLTSYMTQGWNNLGIEVRKTFQQHGVKAGYRKLMQVGTILAGSAVSSQVIRDSLKQLVTEGEISEDQVHQSVAKAMLGYWFTSAYDLSQGQDYAGSVLAGRTPPALAIPYDVAQGIVRGQMNLHWIPVIGGMLQAYVKSEREAGKFFGDMDMDDGDDMDLDMNMDF